MPSSLGSFTPAVSVGADLEGSAPVSSPRDRLARTPVQRTLTASPRVLPPEPTQTSGLIHKVLLEHLSLALEFGGSVLEGCVVPQVLRLTFDLPC